MGEMADYYREHDEEEHLMDAFWNSKQINNDRNQIVIRHYSKWTMQTGIRIQLTKMTNQHLNNSINMIKCRNGWREE